MINSGDMAFMLICAMLVFFMTPGLALFYGGMVRRKNVINTLMSVVFCCGLATMLWFFFGYSLSFGSDVGGLGIIGLALLWPSWYALGWVVLFGLITHTMVLAEEEHLRRMHKEEYDRYCENVPRYIGFPGKS